MSEQSTDYPTFLKNKIELCQFLAQSWNNFANVYVPKEMKEQINNDIMEQITAAYVHTAHELKYISGVQNGVTDEED